MRGADEERVRELREWLLDESDKRQTTSRKRGMADAIIQDLQLAGWRFVYEHVDLTYARPPKHGGLVPVHQKSDELNKLLHDEYGSPLNTEGSFWKWFVAELARWITAKQNRHVYHRPIRHFAHYDEKANVLYVTDRVGGAWKITTDTVEAVELDGVAFLDDARTTKGKRLEIEQALRPVGRDLLREYLLDAMPFSVDPGAVMTSAEQAATVELWLYSLFFGEVQRERPILTSIGPAGSGKTLGQLLVGSLLFGPGFDVTNTPRTDRDFDVIASRRRLLALDNLEEWRPWLAQRLATIATGSDVETRELYSTADVRRFTFDVNVWLSAIDPKINKHDVAQRLLVLRFDPVADRAPQSRFYNRIVRNTPAIWGEMAERIQAILARLKATPNWQRDYTGDFRIADFGALCTVIADAIGTAERWGVDVKDLFGKWGQAQTRFLVESDPFADLLESYLKTQDERIDGLTARELFDKLHDYASDRRLLNNPRIAQTLASARALAPALSALADPDGSRFRVMVTGKQHNAQVYYIELVGGRGEAELVQSYTHAAGRAAMNSELEEVNGLADTLLQMSRHCEDAIRRHERQKPKTTQAKPAESKEVRHGG